MKILFKILFCFFFGIFLVPSLEAKKEQKRAPLKDGEDVIEVVVAVRQKTGLEIKIFKAKYRSIYSDDEYFSIKPTDWKLVVKNKHGKVLSTRHLVFREEWGIGAKEERKTGQDNQSETNSNRLLRASYMNFKDSKENYKVEVYFKGQLNAEAFVKDAKNYVSK